MITMLPNGEVLIGELDPDMEAAVRQWSIEDAWLCNEFEEYLCCRDCDYGGWSDPDDPYAVHALRQANNKEHERKERQRKATDEAREWFWTLLYERTGWLPEFGVNGLRTKIGEPTQGVSS